MGQKANPTGLRLGIIKEHSARWFAKPRNYAKLLESDLRIRKFLGKKLEGKLVSSIAIQRLPDLLITVRSARPGNIIGKNGEDIEPLRQQISQIAGAPVQIVIEEVRKPDMDANLVAQTIAQQLEKRIMFRRAMKRAVTNAIRAGAQGIKVNVSGRLGGAEIARSEWYREGRVPLHTFRADIDYGFAEAKTTYGIIGVKVWIYKGEVLPGSNREDEE